MSIGRVPGATGIQPSIVDAKGDLIVATAADSVDRLAVGSANQVLTVDSSTATGLKWATAAAGGKVLQVVSTVDTSQTNISSATFTDTGLSLAITPSATTSKILILVSQSIYWERTNNTAGMALTLLRGTTEIYKPYTAASGAAAQWTNRISATGATYTAGNTLTTITYLDSPSTTSATTYKTQARVSDTTNGGSLVTEWDSSQSSMILLEIGA